MARKEMGQWGFPHTALGSHSLLYTFILHSYSSSGVLQCRAERQKRVVNDDCFYIALFSAREQTHCSCI